MRYGCKPVISQSNCLFHFPGPDSSQPVQIIGLAHIMQTSIGLIKLLNYHEEPWDSEKDYPASCAVFLEISALITKKRNQSVK